jgi:hypothetical protein
MRTLCSIALLLTSSACASTPGARPTDMSQAGHEAAAQEHGALATTHAGHVDPNALASKTECTGKANTEPCWTSSINPTAGHANEAEQHRKMAADHRAASNALKTAEASACAGLSDADRDGSPFDHRDDVLSVEDLRKQPATAKATQVSTLEGASVSVRAVQGLTKEYLQRLVSCHLARNASMGFAMPEMTACPLSVKGASATVESAGGAFRVDIRGDTKASAEAIARRARELKATR